METMEPNTLLRTEAGGLYFIWSGWEGFANTNQNIYIARMRDPATIVSDRVCISRPEYDWEKQGYPHVNEGPQALVRNGRIFIIYSASGSWTDDYCLGQLTFLGGDPLDPRFLAPGTRTGFAKTATIFVPGHASFVEVEGQITSSTTPPAAARRVGPAKSATSLSASMKTAPPISGSRCKRGLDRFESRCTVTQTRGKEKVE